MNEIHQRQPTLRLAPQTVFLQQVLYCHSAAQLLISGLKNPTVIKILLVELEKAVLKGDIPPTVAAERLISHYKGHYKNQ